MLTWCPSGIHMFAWGPSGFRHSYVHLVSLRFFRTPGTKGEPMRRLPMLCERSTCPWRALATVSAMLVTRTVKRVPAGGMATHAEGKITAVMACSSAESL